MLVNKLAVGTNYYGSYMEISPGESFCQFRYIYLAKIIPKNTKVAGLGEIFVH